MSLALGQILYIQCTGLVLRGYVGRDSLGSNPGHCGLSPGLTYPWTKYELERKLEENVINLYKFVSKQIILLYSCISGKDVLNCNNNNDDDDPHDVIDM